MLESELGWHEIFFLVFDALKYSSQVEQFLSVLWLNSVYIYPQETLITLDCFFIESGLAFPFVIVGMFQFAYFIYTWNCKFLAGRDYIISGIYSQMTNLDSYSSF